MNSIFTGSKLSRLLFRLSRRRAAAGVVLFFAISAWAESYVQFSFRVSPEGNPFSREISADVVSPAGAKLRLPAFFAGEATYSVRAYAGERGSYSLVSVVEQTAAGEVALKLDLASPAKLAVKEPSRMHFVRIDPNDTHRFSTSEGWPYFPVGSNLPWPDKSGMAFYPRVLKMFQAERLNWTRIWMAHWAALNLDWRTVRDGPSPLPGRLDLSVAANWDGVLAAAEAAGVYVQVVLQHHGQYATRVDPNWDINPWNEANPGGFLQKPTDFFTSEQARKLTKAKYRYIVARWGYSPAILCWELFNEVHNTDAMRYEHAEPVVAAWHTEMAAYLRSLDVNHHLVTTSAQNLASPLYSTLDYRQPHLYPAAMLAEVRRMRDMPGDYAGPSFYGEVGDDNLLFSRAAYKSGVALVPSAWASLVGEGTQPAQNWYGERLIETDRLKELGALARVVAAAKLPEQKDLSAFTPAMDGKDRLSLVLRPGQFWEKRAEATISVPFDGREPASYGDFPRVLVGKPESIEEGYASRVTFQMEYALAAKLRIHIADAASQGATLRVQLDGSLAALQVWPGLPHATDSPPPAEKPQPRPAEIVLDVPAGRHVLTLDNTGSPDYVSFDAIDFGVDVPVLAAAGKRNLNYAFLWVWNRSGVFSVDEVPAAEAVVKLDDLSAGKWKVIWWDGLTGVEISSEVQTHSGGPLALETPSISRHAAAVLIREP